MNRNNTEVFGLSTEEELQAIDSEDILHFSEKEYIFLAEDADSISALDELNISLAFSSHREITVAMDMLMILEGTKDIQLNYLSEDKSVIECSYALPFNSIIKLPSKKGSPSKVKIYVVDLYPYVISPRIIEMHILYSIALEFDEEPQVESPAEYAEDMIEEGLDNKNIMLDDYASENTLIDNPLFIEEDFDQSPDQHESNPLPSHIEDPKPEESPLAIPYFDIEAETL